MPVPMGDKMIKDVLRYASSASLLSRLISDNQSAISTSASVIVTSAPLCNLHVISLHGHSIVVLVVLFSLCQLQLFSRYRDMLYMTLISSCL